MHSNLPSRQEIICILGMHRSGTSVTTRILNLLGMYLGPENRLMKPREDNPKGFWEHDLITGLNHEILSRLGGSWHEPPRFEMGWESSPNLADIRQRARALVEEEFSGVELWGWKDPTTCLTLPFWQRLLPTMRYVVCLRNPIDVAYSLQKRDAFAFEKSVHLWLHYVKSALELTTGKSRVLIFYEDLMSNWADETQRLQHFLGRLDFPEAKEIKTSVQQFIDAQLHHHRSSLVDTMDDPNVGYHAKALYMALRLFVGVSRRETPTNSSPERALEIFSAHSFRAGVDAQKTRQEVLSLTNETRRLTNEIQELRVLLEDQAQSRLAVKRDLTDALRRERLLIERLQTLESSVLRKERELVTLLRETLVVRDARIAEMESAVEQLKASREAVDFLERTLADRDSQIAAMEAAQSGLLWDLLCAIRGIKDRWLPPGTKRRQIYDVVLDMVKRLGNHRPALSLVNPTAGPAIERQHNALTESLLDKAQGEYSCFYSVDSLVVKRGRVYGWGWFFVKGQTVTSITVALRRGTESYTVAARYGIRRTDVSKSHPDFVEAEYCGFLVSGELPTEFWDDLCLEARLGDNNIIRVGVNVPLAQRQNFIRYSPIQLDLKQLRIVLSKLLKVPLYLLHGDVSGLVNKIRKHWPEHGLVSQTPGLNVDKLARLAALKKCPVSLIIDHNMGGGANFYRENLVSLKLAAGEVVLVFYYSLPTLTGYLKVVASGFDQLFRVDYPGELLDVVRAIPPNEVFVNNLVSVFDPFEMVDVVKRIRCECETFLTVATHDYFVVCPSWTLVDHKGKFCGIPGIDQCRECLAHHRGFFSNLVRQRDIEKWRARWGSCLEVADRVLCFSRSSAQLLKRAYPKLKNDRIVIAPHNCDHVPKRASREMVGNRLHVGIIGEIAEHKGSRIVAEMAETISRERLPVKITVIGTIDDCCNPGVVRITGPYRREELPEIIDREGINVGFVPSIWPETFSYVTEELMRLALPLAVFDLGAQAERVRAYDKGLVIEEINARQAVYSLLAFYHRLRGTSGSADIGRERVPASAEFC